jgi:hypothetical protein
MRYLKPVFIQQGDIQYRFQFFTTVVPDIGFGTLRFQEVIALFPDTDGMGLNAGQIFQILYGKRIHPLSFMVLSGRIPF